MTSRTAAHRYARALFDVALKEQADLSRVDADLAGFAQLLAANAPLAKVLLNPAVPTPRKRALVSELVARAGMLPVTGKLIVLLAERDRLGLLDELIEAYRERVLEHRKVVRAVITTATPIDHDKARRIEDGLARMTGRTVTLATRVDPSIIGGVVTQVGSTVYDGSVANHLQRMKQRLDEGVGG